MNKNVVSPCISICKTDPLTGYCYGCGRTKKEIVIWKSADTQNDWKEINLEILIERLSGWQKDAFLKSYLNKQRTGLSLIKKELMEAKNS